MFYVRPIARDDLRALLALSERTGAGLTTLPANAERLDRVERTMALNYWTKCYFGSMP